MNKILLFLFSMGCIPFVHSDDYHIQIGLFRKYAVQSIRLEPEVGFGLTLGNTFWKGPITLRSTSKGLEASNPWQKKMVKSPIIVESDSGGIFLSSPELPSHAKGIRLYSGRLHITKSAHKLQIIDETGLENYVAGVLEPETRDLSEPEMLKAQAIAIRTYVLQELGRHKKQGYDLCDSPHCQAYQGIQNLPTRLLRAVQETQGQLLFYGDHPIISYYHSTCGGQTESIRSVWGARAKPYLVSVEDRLSPTEAPFCSKSPTFRWRYEVTKKVFDGFLRKNGWLGKKDSLRTIEVLERSTSGRVQKIRLTGYFWRRNIPGNQFFQQAARNFGWNRWKSANFTIESRNKRFLIKGSGYGHGVGMCQWGAQGMAKRGKTYLEILKHYYPGTRLDLWEEPTLPQAPSPDLLDKPSDESV